MAEFDNISVYNYKIISYYPVKWLYKITKRALSRRYVKNIVGGLKYNPSLRIKITGEGVF
jgi:hypothetical protein